MLQDSFKKILFIVLLICIHTLSAAAQGKNFYISKTSPPWLVKIDTSTTALPPKSVTDGYYTALLERQNHAELKESYTHVIRKIVSGAGVQNGSEISVTYDPSYQKLTFHQITVWRNGHPADKLEGSKFKVLQNEKDLSKFIYSGTYDAYVILDDIRKGDRIEYAFTLTGENPISGNKYTGIFYFEGSNTIVSRYTNLIIDKNRKLTYKNSNFETPPRITEKDGLKMYEWASKKTRTYDKQKFSPSWYNPFKHTQLSEYQSWSEIVDWGLRVNDYPNLQTPVLDKKVKELQLKSGNNQKKYIVSAIRFVQDEVRYMGIEMGAYSQRPNSPEKVLNQRYGDCKDKSLLLIYLLKRVNINAYMAYTDTYDGNILNEFLPSPMIFNHAVVVIEFDHKKIWIDPTISYQRGAFDQIYFPDYGQGLVLKKGVNQPEKVQSRPTGKLVANLTFYPGDTLGLKKTKLIIKSVYTGNEADDMRSTIAEDGADGVESSFLKYYTDYYDDIEVNAALHFEDDEESNTIKITESYLIPAMWQKSEKEKSRYYAYFYGDLISHSIRDIDAKNRTVPMIQKYPQNVEQNITVHFPEAWTITTDPFELKTTAYEFKFDQTVKGKVMSLHYAYKTLKAVIDAKDVKQYVKDADAIKEQLSLGIYWGGKMEPSEINPILLILSAVILTLTAVIFTRVYKQQYEFDLDTLAKAPAVGGWMILLSIGIPLLFIFILTEAIDSGIYNQSRWEHASDNHNGYGLFLQAAYILAAIIYPLKATWLLLLYFLLKSRRELFPKQLTAFMIFATSAIILEWSSELISNYITHQPLNNTYTFIKMICWIIVSLIWIVYLRNTSRVWHTFVFTYPEFSWKPNLIRHMNARIRADQDKN
ncbi:Protein of unknown function [Pedobacter westerhofensis]|uniref:DUF3857 domain-containing protein n=1 Tax=Pedobacter westerhofensis TaxID=425512 RepID=A0A521BMK4_9SPHI|nr:DUF3857 domain-containing protein [Pedobacter westerhofensis]SMO48368.1 Protein of unknown function [Pedobacter westerhofensis]